MTLGTRGMLVCLLAGCGGASPPPTVVHVPEDGPPELSSSAITLDFEDDLFEAGVRLPDIDVPFELDRARGARETIARVRHAWDLRTDRAARAEIEGIDPSTAPPAAAYAIAWILFENGDLPGAVRAIDTAAARWPDGGSARAVRRELAYFHGVAGIDVDTTASALGTGQPIAPLLVELAEAYEEPRDGPLRIAALDRAATEADAANLPHIRTMQAQTVSVVADPERAATAWIAVLASDPGQPDLPLAAAASLHRLFLATGDERYRSAAERLYAALLALPAPPPDVHEYAASLLVATRDRSVSRPTMVRDTIRRHFAYDVRGCVDAMARADRSAQGRFMIEFVVAPDGSVPSATVATSDTPVERGGRCLAERMREWRFPSRDDGAVTVVRYPFVVTTGE